ncbi:hypothetical protein [Alteribacter aurantiacus]|uniref:hypothetical protein n=1 Tax=Alteribacter aurantiacus TaxID=254410 RepID=UPI000427B744|nr:hypothetical protein [Alteribacter aurantiacus]
MKDVCVKGRVKQTQSNGTCLLSQVKEDREKQYSQLLQEWKKITDGLKRLGKE